MNWSVRGDDDADIAYGLQRARARERMRLNLQPQAGPEDARNPPVAAPRVALTAVEAEEMLKYRRRVMN